MINSPTYSPQDEDDPYDETEAELDQLWQQSIRPEDLFDPDRPPWPD